jgi:hypothetical protein
MKRLGVNAGLLCQFWKAYRRIDEIGQNLALQRSPPIPRLPKLPAGEL